MSLSFFSFRNFKKFVRFLLNKFKDYFSISGFLIAFTIFWMFFPFYFWNDLPKSESIVPSTITLEIPTSKESLILKIRTNVNKKGDNEKIYVFDLLPQNITLFRDVRSSVVTRSAENYMMFCKDVNGKVISFQIMVTPPTNNKVNRYNFLFNDIYIGDEGIVSYLCNMNKNNDFFKKSIVNADNDINVF